MRNPFRRLFPRHETYLIFARDLQTKSPPPSELQASLITSANDALAQPLDRFCAQNGFPSDWSRHMLDQGAHAIVASDAQTILAMAWLTTRPFYVEEIDHTLDPAGGAYLFGDFVAPAHRGKGLHRALIQLRLGQTEAPFACTIIRDDNTPSIDNYQALNFAPTTRLTRRRWLGRMISNCNKAGADDRLPVFERHPGNRLVPRTYAASSST